MNGNNDDNHADFSFFDEMQDVDQINQDKASSWKKRLPPVPIKHESLEEDKPAYDRHYLSNVQTGDELSFCRPGLQQRTFQDLRRGRLAIDMDLDLHGLTAKLAQKELEDFFQFCHRHRYKCVLIIHGKGYGSENQPVLKRLVDVWLREREDVLAFCSATSRDGGTGACYALLKSQKSQRHY